MSNRNPCLNTNVQGSLTSPTNCTGACQNAGPMNMDSAPSWNHSCSLQCCGWTTSCTHLKQRKAIAVGIYRGIESFRVFLGGAKRISQPSTVESHSIASSYLRIPYPAPSPWKVPHVLRYSNLDSRFLWTLSDFRGSSCWHRRSWDSIPNSPDIRSLRRCFRYPSLACTIQPYRGRNMELSGQTDLEANSSLCLPSLTQCSTENWMLGTLQREKGDDSTHG